MVEEVKILTLSNHISTINNHFAAISLANYLKWRFLCCDLAQVLRKIFVHNFSKFF